MPRSLAALINTDRCKSAREHSPRSRVIADPLRRASSPLAGQILNLKARDRHLGARAPLVGLNIIVPSTGVTDSATSTRRRRNSEGRHLAAARACIGSFVPTTLGYPEPASHI